MSENSPEVVLEYLPEDAITRAAGLFKVVVSEAVARRGACYLALAGGTTPHALYQTLADSGVSGEMPWPKTHVFFGDERDVPHDHVESNYRMAQRTLLDHLPIRPDQIHPMPADAEDLEAAAGQYEQTIRRIVPAGPDGIPRFDLVLLGMGGEGHTVSLFPCTPKALDEDKKLVLAHFVPVLGRRRMTFTLPLINSASSILMLVLGEDKADAVATILGDERGTRTHHPAARVAPRDGRFILVLDGAAARKSRFRPGA